MQSNCFFVFLFPIEYLSTCEKPWNSKTKEIQNKFKKHDLVDVAQKSNKYSKNNQEMKATTFGIQKKSKKYSKIQKIF